VNEEDLQRGTWNKRVPGGVSDYQTYQLASFEGKKMKSFKGWIFLLPEVTMCLPFASCSEKKEK